MHSAHHLTALWIVFLFSLFSGLLPLPRLLSSLTHKVVAEAGKRVVLCSLETRKLRSGDCITVFQSMKGSGPGDRGRRFSSSTELQQEGLS